MTGDVRAAEPLRPHDPDTLGPYALLGRLGQGGMGTVYLARGADGGLVAVKMIRADLAPDDEFRRRFRSEVDRVRQVPPFCTAEVLDADPDHEPPYLVVEYVDGPSLAEVVRQRGPLTAANLHGVAIGVATALTAIHGAGVIHRDLKPRNVLLAPGSPKVIDFGIARAMEASTRHTGTDQMVGTVAYMAPERFGPDDGMALTTAADIFAWGAVVAYAGTGRTPFGADSAPATAGRILTQPPDLTGLGGPLRSLIAHSLAKAPEDRPTARELLDLLLSTGPQRSPATTAALAHQPDLRAAAREAQAATDHRMAAPAAPTVITAGPPPAASEQPTYAVGLPGTALAEQPTVAPRPIPAQPSGTPVSPAAPPAPQVTGSAGAEAVGVGEAGTGEAGADEGVAGGAASSAGQAAAAEPATGHRWRRWVVVAVTVVLLGGAAAAVLVNRPANAPAPAPVSPSATVQEASVDSALRFTDPLVSRRYWTPSTNRDEKAGCTFAGALLVRRQTPGSFRCQGPEDVLSPDQRVDVGVRLLRKGSCASIWFRFADNRGYQVRVCEAVVLVGTHKSTATKVYRTFPLDRPVAVGAPSTRISVSVRGRQAQVSRDGQRLGTVPLTDRDITEGRVMLGIFTESAELGYHPPFEVAFDHVTVWSF